MKLSREVLAIIIGLFVGLGSALAVPRYTPPPGGGNFWQIVSGNGISTTSPYLIRSLTFDTSSPNNAIAFQSNGARLDLGTGSLDYISSDGTNLATLTRFSAAPLFSTASGVVIQNQSSFPTALANTHLAANSSFLMQPGTGLFMHDGVTWRQLGMGKNYGLQQKMLAVDTAYERTDCPKVRVNLADSSGADVTVSCRTRTQAGTTGADTTATSVVRNNRSYRVNVTQGNSPGTDIEKSYVFTGATDTMTTYTQARFQPFHCAWVTFDGSPNNGRFWHALSNTDFNTVTGTNTPTTAHVIGFRYFAPTDPRWMFVTCAGTACTVTSTGTDIFPNSTYSMCAGIDASGRAFGVVTRTGTNLGDIIVHNTNVPTTTFLGMYHYVESLTDVALGFGLSNFSTETN